MKKQQLFSLAALCTAIWTPFTLVTAPAVFSLEAAETEKASLSADEFLEAYCGGKAVTILPDGSSTEQFIWYETVTDQNRDQILAGKAVFDTLDPAVRETIVQAERARSVDYYALTELAAKQKAELDAALKKPQPVQDEALSPEQNQKAPSLPENSQPDSKESQPVKETPEKTDKKDSESAAKQEQTSPSVQPESPDQPDSDKDEDKEKETESRNSSNPDRKDASDSDAPSKKEDSLHEKQEKEDQKPADSSKPAPSSDQKDVKEPAKTQPDSSGSSDPQDSNDNTDSDSKNDSKTKEDSPDHSDQTLEDSDLKDENEKSETPDAQPVLDASGLNVPENPGTAPAGLSSSPAEAAIDDTIWQTAAAIAGKTGLKDWVLVPVVYSYTFEGQPLQSQIYYFVQDPVRTIIFQIKASDEQSVTVQFFNDNSCTYNADAGILELAGKNEAVLPWILPASKGEAKDDQQAEKASVSMKKPDMNPGESNSSVRENALPDPAAALEENTASLKIPQPDAGQPAVEPENAISRDQQIADDFINRYCYRQGGLIRQATVANCQQILNGLTSWEAMNSMQKQLVNNYLVSMGSLRWQTLYRQANQVRLGLPVSSQIDTGYSGTDRAESVHTGSAQDFALWLLGAVGSLETMIVMALKPKKKNEQ